MYGYCVANLSSQDTSWVWTKSGSTGITVLPVIKSKYIELHLKFEKVHLTGLSSTMPENIIFCIMFCQKQPLLNTWYYCCVAQWRTQDLMIRPWSQSVREARVQRQIDMQNLSTFPPTEELVQDLTPPRYLNVLKLSAQTTRGGMFYLMSRENCAENVIHNNFTHPAMKQKYFETTRTCWNLYQKIHIHCMLIIMLS